MATSQIGVIGLGAMGAGMARNLLKAGFTVRAFDIDPGAVQRIAEAGATAAKSPAEAAADADVLAIIVFSAEQADAVLFGANGALEALPRGATVANHTTVSPDQARALAARLADQGYGYVDAPVTGGKTGADDATLTVIASGAVDAVTAAEAAFNAMSARIARISDKPGDASAVKMINQLLVGIHNVATAEAMALAARAGVNPHTVVDVISNGMGYSRIFESRAPDMMSGDFSPRGATAIMVKDLGIILDAARSLRFPLPLTSAAQQQFLAACGAGLERVDMSALVKLYEAAMDTSVQAAANEN